jgi:hypothetical protein
MTIRSLLQAFAWSLVLPLILVGCGSGNDTDDKTDCLTALRINLEVADGTIIDEVEYEITGNGMMPMGDTINTSAPGATASVEQFGIPVGEGYLVTMIATSVDGSLTCGGSSTFDVAAGVSTEVDVILNCKGSEQFGGVRVNGKLNICAELDKVIVAPLQTSSGFALEVSALGSDSEKDDFEYRWTATGGSFDEPSAAVTVFNCEGPSSEMLTVEVSDDGFVYCIDGWTVPVDCVDGDGGAGGNGGDGGAAGTGGDPGTGGTGGSATGGSGGSGTGGSGGSGTGGSGGSGTGGSGGSGTGGSGGSGTGGSGGSGTGGSGGSGTGGTIPPECLVSVSVE